MKTKKLAAGKIEITLTKAEAFALGTVLTEFNEAFLGMIWKDCRSLCTKLNRKLANTTYKQRGMKPEKHRYN
jgi:hypothetical protein